MKRSLPKSYDWLRTSSRQRKMAGSKVQYWPASPWWNSLGAGAGVRSLRAHLSQSPPHLEILKKEVTQDSSRKNQLGRKNGTALRSASEFTNLQPPLSQCWSS